MRGQSGDGHNLKRGRRAVVAAYGIGVVALVISALVSGGGRGVHSVRAGRLAFIAAHRTATLPTASPFDDPEATTTTLDPTSTSTEPPTTAVPSTTTTVPSDTTTVPPTTTTVLSTTTTVRSTPTTVRSTPTTVRSAPPTTPGATSTPAQPMPRSRQRLVAARVSAPTRKQPSKTQRQPTPSSSNGHKSSLAPSQKLSAAPTGATSAPIETQPPLANTNDARTHADVKRGHAGFLAIGLAVAVAFALGLRHAIARRRRQRARVGLIAPAAAVVVAGVNRRVNLEKQ